MVETSINGPRAFTFRIKTTKLQAAAGPDSWPPETGVLAEPAIATTILGKIWWVLDLDRPARELSQRTRIS
jgi:hypothetical protein